MMARNTNVPSRGRIDKRKTYHLQIITFAPPTMCGRSIQKVESRMGAVTPAIWRRSVSHPRSLNQDVPISGVRLPDWLHRKAHNGAINCRRSRRSRPRPVEAHRRTGVCRARELVPSGEEVAHAFIDVSVNTEMPNRHVPWQK